ncbi:MULTISPECIES: MafI family immunity protein [Dyadobacter]|uniref:MafI family immunity protein n=1 Tax=Dyadobacter TaxID=120831 RepID=UPI0038D483C5
MFRKSLNTEIRDLISKCESFGLPEKDCIEASSFLDYHEFGLAFDTIVTQMFEYNILIDSELYLQIEVIARKMSLSGQEYEYISKLIRPSK